MDEKSKKRYIMGKVDKDYQFITGRDEYLFPDEKVSEYIEIILEKNRIKTMEELAIIFNRKARPFGVCVISSPVTLGGWRAKYHCPRGRKRVILEEIYLESLHRK